MKDKHSQATDREMATTTLNRISSLTLTPPVLGFNFPASYSRCPSFPIHTDWGPSSRNPDELAAAVAITELSRSQSNLRETTSKFSSTSDSLRASNLSVGSTHINNRDLDSKDTTGSIKSSISRNMVRSPQFPVVIKSEPIDVKEAALSDAKRTRNSISAEGTDVPKRRFPMEGGYYVRTCQQADIKRASSDELNPIRALPSAVESSCSSTLNMERSSVLSPRRTETLIKNDRQRISSGDLDRNIRRHVRPSSIPNLASFGLLVKSDHVHDLREKQEFLGYKNRVDGQSHYKSCEQISAPRVQPHDKGYDSPTSFLKRKVQYSIELARRRYQSDDSGLVRHRIMEGNFGSLSAIETYIKRLHLSNHSRLPLDDNAIDLSTRKRVNTRRLSDDTLAVNSLVNESIALPINSEGASRGTTEQPTAFKQYDLWSSAPAVESYECKTTDQQQRAGLKQSRSEPHSLCDLGNVCTEISVPGTRTSTRIYPQAIITQHKSEDNIGSHVLLAQSVFQVNEPNLRNQKYLSFSGSLEEVRERDDAVLNRKSRSPTFQLPDCQLPLKKRRMFGTCWEDSDVDRKPQTNVINKTSSTTESIKDDVCVTDKNPVIRLDRSHGSVLSAFQPDEDGDMPIHIAVVQGRISTVERLLTVMKKHEISVDHCNNQKQTALHLAVITNQSEAIDLLLEGGASLHLRDRHGNGVIHLAVKHSNEILAKLLDISRISNHFATKKQHNHNLDLNGRNFEGVTPLQMAVQHGNYEAVRLLISSGADVDAQEGKNGRTALYLAAELNLLSIARLLLDSGANVALLSYSGCSPVQAASGFNHSGLVQLLEERGVHNR